AVITYGFGHLVSLYEPQDYDKNLKKWDLTKLPIVPEQFKFKVGSGKSKQYNIVKKQLDEADTIVIATDGDREGEAIARLIINLSGNSHKELKRLWINSLEKQEIKKGFLHLKNGEEFYSSYKEAETRQIADWLVGINLSRLYTLYMQQNGVQGVFSIGRVQTPTLFLIYQRNDEIERFVTKPFYELIAHFQHKNGPYEGKYRERFESEEVLNAFKEKNGLVDQSKGMIEEVKTEEKKLYPPKLFSLSDLQAAANKRFGFGASDTLKTVQSLYEKKLVSYPRTDCNYIGQPEFKYLKEKLPHYLKLAGEKIDAPQLKESKRYVDDQKVQEHYALIPTRTLPNLEKLADKERKIYQLILYRTVAIFEKPYVYDETKITTTINSIPFKTTGKIEKALGWKQLYPKERKDTEKRLPDSAKNDEVISNLETKKGSTQPPKHYTEGTLITAMKTIGGTSKDEENKTILKETEGIGTEATRANVIETLKKQEYIRIQKKTILVTEKGKTLCRIIKNDEITNADMTAKWEKYLKKIRHQEGTQEAFLNSITNFISHLIKQVPETFKNKPVEGQIQESERKNTLGSCPNCQKTVVDKGKFYGCEGYKDGCRFTLPKKWSSKTLTKKNLTDLLTKKETTII
ncbi:MAG: DNA topoisomerase 3, partial [Pisciglobus halotolerans]|nr:DNA topoisomerase 3 [Pisciglobus halotolerans]